MPKLDYEEYGRVNNLVLLMMVPFLVIGIILFLIGIFPVFLFPIMFLLNGVIIWRSKLDRFYKILFLAFGSLAFFVSIVFCAIFYNLV